MSTMFRKSLESHVGQVRTRIDAVNPAHINKELEAARSFLTLTTDTHTKRALEKTITRLERAKKDAGSTDDLKKLLTSMENLLSSIKSRPEYNVQRTPRVEVKKEKKEKH